MLGISSKIVFYFLPGPRFASDAPTVAAVFSLFPSIGAFALTLVSVVFKKSLDLAIKEGVLTNTAQCEEAT